MDTNNWHMPTTIKSVKPGDYVRLKVDGPVWVRGAYDRSSGTYSLTSFDDKNREIYRKGTAKAFTGFTF